MKTFDAAHAGTREEQWHQCEWLRAAPELAPPSHEKLTVLAAHPDDETLGAGGLISYAACLGLDVHVIIASDGAASHPNSPTHTPAMLAELRTREARAAVAVLAPQATVEFLDLPDGRLDECGQALDEALDGARLVATTWAFDGHPDHAACARAARRLVGATLLEFPIWAWHWGNPRDDFTLLDPASPALRRLTLADPARKAAALACYRSQTAPLSRAAGDEALLSRATLAYFGRDVEYFLRVRP